MSEISEPATRLFWLPEPRDPSAPTAEELAHGIELTAQIVPGSISYAAEADAEYALDGTLTFPSELTLTLSGRTHITRGWTLTLDHAVGDHRSRRYRACPGCNPRRDRPVGPPPAPHARGYHAKTRRRNRR